MAEPLDYIIFTDGSVRTDRRTGKTYAGYGVVLYNCTTHAYAMFGGELGSRTISFAESYAINRAVAKIIDLVSYDVAMPRRVLILTDSKYCVQSYNVWLPHWKHKAIDGIWVNSKHEPVQNQELIKRTLANLSGHNNVRVQITHINSHLSMNKSGDLDRIIRKLKPYGLKADQETAKVIIHMNALADQTATMYSQISKDAGETQSFIQLRPKLKYYNGTEIESYEKEDLS